MNAFLASKWAWLKAAWRHLVTEEKALFKSATMYLALLLAAAPQILQNAQDSWPTLAPYLPGILQSKGLGWIAVSIFICRIESMLRAVQVSQDHP